MTDAFHAAALGMGSWYEALDGLAKATGSRTGELIGIGLNAIEFNVITNVDVAGFNRDFLASGGYDPTWNIRVRAGMSAPVLKVLAESDFLSPSEHKRDPHYQEFSRRRDFLYTCLATLDRSESGLIGLAVLRSECEGHITDAQREVFSTLAPFVRSAVLTQKALEGQGTAVLAGAMEALSMPALLGVTRQIELVARLNQLQAGRLDTRIRRATSVDFGLSRGVIVSADSLPPY